MEISDIGLILDIIAIGLLAFYSVATNPIYPDGSEGFNLNLGEPKVSLNKDKYKRYKRITIIAYIMLCVGFLLQLHITTNLLQWIQGLG